MTADRTEAVGLSGSAAEALETLSDIVGKVVVPASGRVQAAADSRSPQEGRALLGAYVGIEDRRLRQALLDLVVAVSHATTR